MVVSSELIVLETASRAASDKSFYALYVSTKTEKAESLHHQKHTEKHVI